MIILNSSLRKFNKSRRKLPLGKDDLGKVIYPYDFIKIQIPHETRTHYCSRVYWNALDGAFVDSHPAHLLLNNQQSYRNLRDFISKVYAPDTICLKISLSEFNEWKIERELKQN